MGDAMAASAEQEDEAEDVYNQILGEVNMELIQAQTGSGVIAVKKAAEQQVPQQQNAEIDDLEARLASLV